MLVVASASIHVEHRIISVSRLMDGQALKQKELELQEAGYPQSSSNPFWESRVSQGNKCIAHEQDDGGGYLIDAVPPVAAPGFHA